MNPLDPQHFRNPPARARLAPFWFWNCGMDEDLIRRQVQQMARAGCGGFFIHPRQGMTLPYLSKTYFARVRLAVEEAQKRGLEVWLYDEYPYPSGIAGGLVTANHPEFRARVLDKHDFNARGGETVRQEFELGRVVCALAYPLRNGKVDWGEGMDLRAEIGVVLTREQFWYWPMGHIPTNEKRFMADEGRLVLSWNPPPGEWQICVGIEREQRGFKYYDCFFDPLASGAAEEFIALTHERYAAALGEFFGETIVGIFTDETEPPAWSPHLESALEPKLLPALWRDDHPRAAQARVRWRERALELFRARWEEPIGAWCRAHHLIWGAEKPTWRPAQFWNVAQPATDAGHRRLPAPPEPLTADLRANARAAIAAAEACGTEEVRCECFHSLGWGATLQDQKWACDWLAAQGVNRFTPHAFYATSSGLKKHDAAPSFFAENPYWPHFGLLADYVARLSLAMSAGRERARVAVVHPTEMLWSGDASARADYEQLINELLAHHVQFHIVDARSLSEATARAGALEIGRARYETVVFFGADSTEIEAARRAAVGAGLAIIEAENWRELAASNPLQLRDENAGELPAVWTLWRETQSQQLLFFANTGGQKIEARVRVRADVAGWQIWSLERGEIESLEVGIEDGESYFTLNLAPYGSALLVGDANASAPQTAAARPERTVALPLDGTWNLKLDRPNALRLNRWRAASGSGDWSARPLENARAIEALPLRYRDARGAGWTDALERAPGAPVWYQRVVECDWVPQNLEVLVENGAIAGDWQLWINGEPVPAAAFEARDYNGADKIAAPIAPWFHLGENLLALCVENAPPLGGLVTPLHLLGDFALQGARRLIKVPPTARFGDLVGAGLPHFSGEATFARILNLGEATALELPADFGDVAELRVNGQSLGARAWPPYRWDWPRCDGAIEVEIAVTNTLLPFVEGQ